MACSKPVISIPTTEIDYLELLYKRTKYLLTDTKIEKPIAIELGSQKLETREPVLLGRLRNIMEAETTL